MRAIRHGKKPARGVFLRCALCALVCASMLLSGCSNMTFESASDLGEASLPKPDESEPSAPIGDSRARYGMRTLLYYSNAENALSSALRLLYVDEGESALKNVVDALLEAPYSSSGLAAIAPNGTKCLSCTLSEGLATVDLSAAALSQGESAEFWELRAAVTRTLLEQEGVRWVNVLVEGRACEVEGYPLGVSDELETGLTVGYARWKAESDKYGADPHSATLARTAAVYLPASSEGVLLPVMASVSIGSAGIEQPLIASWLAAASASADEGARLAALAFADATAETAVTPEGERIITLRLGNAAANQNEYDVSRAEAALALTLCRFVPNADGVRVLSGGTYMEKLLLLVTWVEPEDGVFRPDRLSAAIGTGATLYLPDGQGRLRAIRKALPGSEQTAREIITALVSECADAGAPLFPEGANASDLLGVRLEEGVAHINLSSTLYSACQSYDEARERAFVYAIVNTLIENLPTVNRVQFYIADRYAETLAGSISIRSPLMANPGIVSESAAVVQ